ncbi:TaqI-like C-terminal specificity domain-containing protein [Algoriphagus sp.]|uniref:TaqI-like C-terminal specificity domain-containing protein n=1 Tax=Algoriphagus sp. TaxID=1872435 RepID=UPI00271FCE05|nr:TaqI-like C-terminal specificity domain-containing protein [Algoriphagus sp.]MDO8966702.1 TaqI-like C-terminal specificity domain-containing protein [Algoriphagus sp.]MDP3198957.1 TaqI-like C-terminal specificity domain-containing protein [Algoriphagus sp.]
MGTDGLPLSYSKAKQYFDCNRDLLKKRHVAIKNPNLWYKTIDKINTKLIFQSKILLPDISGNTHLFIDEGNFYPHHNLYYIAGQKYEYLIVLAAILMSDFVRDQLLEIGNKMNGGYPRWQSQNLRKLRVPILNAIPPEVFSALVKAYYNRDYDIINELVKADRISEYSYNEGQTVLFEPSSEPYRLS